jgi:hypothetical protein
MEPRQQKPKTAKPGTEEKPKRFRLVKLEERIAPGQPAGSYVVTCGCTVVIGVCALTHPPGHCK